MNIKIEAGISDKNIEEIINWTNTKGEEFLEQWAGKSMKFPLDYNQVKMLKDGIFSIFYEDEFAGMIQKIREDENNVHIGRFIVNPGLTGRGIGKKALTGFCKMMFQNEKIKTISLNVFEYNKNAKKLYEKTGFEVAEVIDQGEFEKYRMVLEKSI